MSFAVQCSVLLNCSIHAFYILMVFLYFSMSIYYVKTNRTYLVVTVVDYNKWHL